MNLTLKEAAALLGKSPRQLRYLIKKGEIRGRQVEGRWVFDSEDLPRSPGQERARSRKAEELAAAVEEALGPHLRPAGRKGYSVVDLAAFRVGLEQCRTAQALRPDGAAAGALRQSLVALAQGCHRFHHRDKADAFRAAREHAAEAIVHLHLDGTDASRTFASAIESEYLSALSGLLRRQERQGPERQDRHERKDRP